MLGRGPLIYRLTWSDQLYRLGRVSSRMYSPRLQSPSLFSGEVWVGVQLNMLLCPVHVVVGLVDLPDCILTVLAQGLHRRIVAAACAWGNFLQVAHGCISQRRGP